MRKPASIESQIAGVINRHSLEKIEIVALPRGFVVRAIPNSFNPIVEARRQEAFAKCTGSISIAEATRITSEALAPLASERGRTIAEAISDLDKALKPITKRVDP